MEMGVVNGQQRYDNFCISEHNYLDTNNNTYNIICIATEGNTMEKELFVIEKKVWGNDRLYPDCETSTFFTQVHGTKIITETLEGILRSKGFTFSVKPRQI